MDPQVRKYLEGTEVHRGSPSVSAEQEQQAQQSALGSSGAFEQARPPTQETGGAPNEEDQPVPSQVVPLSRISEVLRNEEEYQRKKTAPIPTIVVDEEEEDADMNVPIRMVMKRMKFVGHRPRQAKVMKLDTQDPIAQPVVP
ncbi:hypothetical protein Dimus_022571 [Dionaea muscipula]